jgi:hypothetical protein
VTVIDMLIMKRALRRGSYPDASPALVAEADRARAAYEDRRNDIVQRMFADANSGAVPIAGGLVAVADPDPEMRARAAHLHDTATER